MLDFNEPNLNLQDTLLTMFVECLKLRVWHDCKSEGKWTEWESDHYDTSRNHNSGHPFPIQFSIELIQKSNYATISLYISIAICSAVKHQYEWSRRKSESRPFQLMSSAFETSPVSDDTSWFSLHQLQTKFWVQKVYSKPILVPEYIPHWWKQFSLLHLLSMIVLRNCFETIKSWYSGPIYDCGTPSFWFNNTLQIPKFLYI